MVGGECAQVLAAALRQMKRRDTGDGMASITLELPGEQMAPVDRAHRLIETELILEDTHFGGKESEARTDEERSFDAFTLLIERTFAAVH